MNGNGKEKGKMKSSKELELELAEYERQEAEFAKEWAKEVEGTHDETRYDHPLWKKISEAYDKEMEIKEMIISAKQAEVKVGDGITISGYTDRYAYTVIKRTEKTLTVQRDKATLKPDWKPNMIPGGFSVICLNNEDQKYDYERDPEGGIKTLYWSDKRNLWLYKGKSVMLGRHEFYDYNF